MRDQRSAAAIRFLALVVILGLLASVGVLLWADQRASALTGPTAIAVDPAGAVYVASDRELLWADREGRLLGRRALGALGLQGPVSDLAAPGDGALLVADRGRGTVLRCVLEPPLCVPLLERKGENAGIYQGAPGLAWDPSRGRIYVSDPARGRVDVYDSDGGFLDTTRSVDPHLKAPNAPTVSDDGLLVVADTGNHRLVALETEADKYGEPAWSLPAIPAGMSSCQSLPVDLARSARGEWWVLHAASRWAAARVVVFGPEGGLNREVELDEDAEPTALAADAEEVLVLDRGRMRVLRFGPDGQARGVFGDAALRGALGELVSERERYRRLERSAGWALALCVMLAVLVAGLDRRRRRAEAGSTRRGEMAEGSHSAQVRWLLPRRNAGRAPLLLSAVVVLLAGLALALSGRLASRPMWLALLVGLAAVLGPLYYLLRSLRSTRIGIDGERLILVDHRGCEASGQGSEILYSDRALLIGEVAVLTRGSELLEIYPFEELVREVYPRLKDARKLGLFAMERELLRRRHPVAVVPWFLVFGILLLILVLALLLVLLGRTG